MERTLALDEGYIEDLKQPMNSTGAHFFKPNQHMMPSGGNPLDPSGNSYSYVCDTDIRIHQHNLAHTVHNNEHPPSFHMLNGHFVANLQANNNQLDASENEYEEIRDVARYFTSQLPDPEETNSENQSSSVLDSENNSRASTSGKNNIEPTKPDEISSTKIESESKKIVPKHFKSFSSTDDILAEVVHVKQGHDRVLDQLNLEVENLLLRSSSEIEGNLYVNSENIVGEIQKLSSALVVGNTTRLLHGSSCSNSSSCVCETDEDCKMLKSTTSTRGIKTGSLKFNHQKSASDSQSSTFTRRKKSLDRSATTNDCTSLGKPCEDTKTNGDGVGLTKGRYHRSYSLIPHWKIREHLRRLPFLKQQNGKHLNSTCMRCFVDITSAMTLHLPKALLVPSSCKCTLIHTEKFFFCCLVKLLEKVRKRKK